MPRKGYQNLTFGTDEYNVLKKKYDELNIEKEKGLSFTRWVATELSLSLEKMQFLKRYAPALSLVGVHQDSILIQDSKANSIVQISLRNNTLHCSVDKSNDCDHIHYALILSELGKICNAKTKRD